MEPEVPPDRRRHRRLPAELDPRRAGRPAGKRSARRRSGPLARTIKVLAALLSVTVLVTSGVMWASYRKFSAQVTRIDAVPAGGGGHHQHHNGTAQNILLVGNSSRAGLTPAELKDVSTQYTPSYATDTILVLHIPANGDRATVISFPRDSYVTIPGFRSGKINAAYVDGACANGCSGAQLTHAQNAAGARELITTIQGLTGMHIDHYVEVNLFGFYRITKVLGGVQVCLKHAVKDHYSGIDLPAGRQTIEGTQALAFVRQRHGLPHGDLDRIVRQQVFLSAIIRKVLSGGTLLNPIKLNDLLDAVSQSLIFDKGFDPLSLADQVQNIAAGHITFRTIPIVNPNAYVPGVGDVVSIDKTAVRTFIQHVLAGGTAHPSAPAPSRTIPRRKVKVEVLNGTSTDGLAARTRSELETAGFSAVGAVNANRSDYPRTLIRYSPAHSRAAHTLARVVPGAGLTVDPSAGADVQLVLGRGFGGVHTTSRPSPSSGSHAKGPTTPRTAAQTGCVD